MVSWCCNLHFHNHAKASFDQKLEVAKLLRPSQGPNSQIPKSKVSNPKSEESNSLNSKAWLYRQTVACNTTGLGGWEGRLTDTAFYLFKYSTVSEAMLSWLSLASHLGAVVVALLVWETWTPQPQTPWTPCTWEVQQCLPPLETPSLHSHLLAAGSDQVTGMIFFLRIEEICLINWTWTVAWQWAENSFSSSFSNTYLFTEKEYQLLTRQ